MISNQILQSNIEGLKEITRIDLCVCDVEGKVLASTFEHAEEYESSILAFVDSPADSQVISGYQFFKVFDEHQLEYILLAKGGSDDVYMVGKLAAFQIQNLLVAYKERFDKDNFIKNLLLDNLLLVDIYNRAKKLHIETNVRRVVFLIETKQEKDINALETVRSLFATKTKDFITAVDEKNIILVKEVKPNEDYADLEKTASVILDMLSSEAMTKVRVAYGTVVNDIKEVSRSYKEAKMALDVGKIFFEERPIIEENPTYEELKEWYEKSGMPLKKFFNTSGMLYKQMNLKDKLPEMSEDEQLKLLATDGMLVKRPLVVGEDFVLTGFREKEWEEKIRG